MKTRKIVALLLTALCVLSAATTGCGSQGATSSSMAGQTPQSTSEEKITLRLGDAAGPALGSAIAAQNFCALVEETSGGRIHIEYYGNAQLGDDGDLMEQVIDGNLDIGMVSSSMFTQYSSDVNALQLPFLIDSYEKEYTALTSPEMAAIFDTLKPFNIKVIGAFENGITHFANSKHAVNTPEDLKGLLLRCAPASIIVESMGALGISTADIPFNEIYTALQNGVIEGQVQNIGSIYSMKHYEVTKYISLIGLYPFPVLIAMSDKVYSSLSADDQALLIDCAAKATKTSLEGIAAYEQNVCLKAMEEQGVQVNIIEDRTPFIEATKSVYGKYMNSELVANFVSMVRGLD